MASKQFIEKATGIVNREIYLVNPPKEEPKMLDSISGYESPQVWFVIGVCAVIIVIAILIRTR